MAKMTLAEAKKKTDAKIKKNRQKYFGTQKSGPPSSNKRLKDTKVGKFFSSLFRGPGKESAATETKKTKKPGAMPTKKPNIAKLKYGMGQVDSLSKAKVKQGPPKPPAKTKTVKKKNRSNISNSSTYDASFTRKGLESRGLSPKASMSAKNYAKTVKPKGVMTGPEMFKKKKDDGKAPMYESKGTMGGVKKTKYAAKGMSGKKTKYASGGGKMKMAKYYSSGGMVFTGR